MGLSSSDELPWLSPITSFKFPQSEVDWTTWNRFTNLGTISDGGRTGSYNIGPTWPLGLGIGTFPEMLSAAINRKHIKKWPKLWGKLIVNTMSRDMEFWDWLIHHQGHSIFPSVSKKSGEIAIGYIRSSDCHRGVVVSQTTTPRGVYHRYASGKSKETKRNRLGWGWKWAFQRPEPQRLCKRSYKNTCKVSSSARKTSLGLGEEVPSSLMGPGTRVFISGGQENYSGQV